MPKGPWKFFSRFWNNHMEVKEPESPTVSETVKALRNGPVSVINVSGLDSEGIKRELEKESHGEGVICLFDRRGRLGAILPKEGYSKKETEGERSPESEEKGDEDKG